MNCIKKYVINPQTGRCVKKAGKIGNKLQSPTVCRKLIENNLIEFEGGDFDWLYNELCVYGEEDNWNVYYKEYMDLLNNIK